MENWNRIVIDHGPLVFQAAWRILGHTADTEDVVQEVFLEAHRFVHDREVKNWGGMLRRLATYRALDRLRRRRSTLSLEKFPLADHQEGPEEAVLNRELAERLRRAVADLPEREAAVFSLRFFEELSNRQIAETLRISEGAVAAALYKARAKLEALFADAPKENTCER